MNPFFAWLEQTGLSVWVRESPSLWAFPTVLIFHAVGMGFLAGANVAIDLRLLGVAARLQLAPMERFFPVLWFGLWVNVVSGVLLLIAYPTKALTNPVFYVKLSCIALALVVLRQIRIQVFRDPALDRQPLPRRSKMLAATSILLWAGAITAGRLLAYTYTRLMVNE